MNFHVEFWDYVTPAKEIPLIGKTLAFYIVMDSTGTEWGFGEKDVCDRLCKVLNSIKGKLSL